LQTQFPIVELWVKSNWFDWAKGNCRDKTVAVSLIVSTELEIISAIWFVKMKVDVVEFMKPGGWIRPGS
jgi:hypothetical protein